MSMEAPTPSKRHSGRSPMIDRKISAASQLKNKRKYLGRQKKETGSDSEDSDDNESMESEQTDSIESKSAKPFKGKVKRRTHHDWEILEGLKDGQKCEDKPDKYEGLMMKRRKWPMKGWHKRYFVLENGVLTYAKSTNDIQKGKIHGTIDLGLSVLTYKRDGRRIDIDADDLIYHLKVKNTVLFDEWLSQMRHHRLHRQHELAFGTTSAPKLTDVSTPVEDLTPITSPVSPSMY
jgi:hypothetical protein